MQRPPPRSTRTYTPFHYTTLFRSLAATCMVDGITTKPSLVAKSGRDFFEVLKEICEVVPGPVSAEVTAVDFEGMLNEGRALAKLADNIVVKAPLTVDGLKTCKEIGRAHV